MMWLIGLMGLSVVVLILVGVYLELRPQRPPKDLPRWLKGGVLAHWVIFALGLVGLLLLGIEQALAQEVAAGGGREITLGLGLAIIGAGLPTAVAAIGAGIALGPVGSAALAVIAEKPELFGRTLIYLGLAEGIAIYGLVISILLLGKI